MTYRPDDSTVAATGRCSEAADVLGRSLYDVMERLETSEPPGEPWDELPEVYKPWYRACAVALLTNPCVLETAKVLSAAQ